MATCGPSNAASQMNKLVNTDNSLHHEHANGTPPPASMGLRGDPRQLSQMDRQRLENMQQGHPNFMRLDSVRRDLPVYNSPQQQNPQTMNWAQEFHQSPQPQSMHSPSPSISSTTLAAPGGANWAQEFQSAGPAGPSTSAQQPMYNRFGNGMGMGMGMGGGYMPMGSSMMGAGGMSTGMASGVTQNAPATATANRSEQWDAEFEKMEKGLTANMEPATQTDTNAGVNAEAEAEAEATDTAAKTNADVDTSTTLNTERIMTESEEDEMERTIHNSDAMFMEGSYPPNWDEMWDTINNEGTPGTIRTEQFQSQPGVYRFETDNPFEHEEDPFQMGVMLMDGGYKLSTAVLCFEEAVRRNTQHVEAWARLGAAQAQNEVEDQAIIALERAIALNPQHDRALLNLAISYTNEGYDAAASMLLEKWISFRYPQIADTVPKAKDQTAESLHARVTQMFLKVATQADNVDSDVQAGLGVLCYRNDDYTKAVDCFRAALSVNENESSLWNRLGATLANASRPEEAITAYERALTLRPSFVRARYNLAVSYINIGCYKEAVEHLLAALALHETDGHEGVDMNASSSLVDTLRRVFFAMNRRDLLAHLQQGFNLDVFRGEFNF